jgi:hypothetical protein
VTTSVQSEYSKADELANDLMLARRAAAGEAPARKQVATLADPLVRNKATGLCKKYCQGNRYRAVCTLDRNWSRCTDHSPLCEWGNASYAQLFTEITKPETLLRYQARNGCTLQGFFTATLHSIGVIERWKDMRFGRRVNVPDCVQKLGSHARSVFLWMCDFDTIPNMAQRLKLSEAETETLARAVCDALVAAGCSYTLEPPREISLTGLGVCDDDDETSSADEADIPTNGADYCEEQLQRRVLAGLEQLDAVSRFVLKAKFWENLAMQEILEVLKAEGIALRKGVAAQNTNLNQLYYFYYQALTRLRELSGI